MSCRHTSAEPGATAPLCAGAREQEPPEWRCPLTVGLREESQHTSARVQNRGRRSREYRSPAAQVDDSMSRRSRGSLPPQCYFGEAQPLTGRTRCTYMHWASAQRAGPQGSGWGPTWVKHPRGKRTEAWTMTCLLWHRPAWAPAVHGGIRSLGSAWAAPILGAWARSAMAGVVLVRTAGAIGGRPESSVPRWHLRAASVGGDGTPWRHGQHWLRNDHRHLMMTHGHTENHPMEQHSGTCVHGGQCVPRVRAWSARPACALCVPLQSVLRVCGPSVGPELIGCVWL